MKVFVTAHTLKSHPMANTRLELRARYYYALEYFIRFCSSDIEFSMARLEQYRSLLLRNNTADNMTQTNLYDVIKGIVSDSFRPWKRLEQCRSLLVGNNATVNMTQTDLYDEIKGIINDSFRPWRRLEQCRSLLVENNTVVDMTQMNLNDVIKGIVNDSFRPWRRKYLYWLFCDIALVLMDELQITKAKGLLARFLNHSQMKLLESLNAVLYNDEPISVTYAPAEILIRQFRANRNFTVLPEKRFILTANVSAGKSTLINALIGKRLTRTSLEACTANLCFLYNKPFEDNAVHMIASPLNLNASDEDIAQSEKTEVSYISSFFRALSPKQERVCIIDTPGLNFAIDRNHGKLTRKALTEEIYDNLIYVFNANRLGTDEEMENLKFVTENVPKEKVIFVLNKLDDFNKKDDSIEESIEAVKQDLLGLGYENPIICPISAYFALLIKLKQYGEILTDDENDEYLLYSKKYSKPEYDLSRYYPQENAAKITENDLTALAAKCGFLGLEQVLYEGKSKG
jgi:GTP-binding protein EngB required for normal cell division